MSSRCAQAKLAASAAPLPATALTRLTLALGMTLALLLALGWDGAAQASAAAQQTVPRSFPEPEITTPQAEAAAEFAGPDGSVSRNNVLVTRADGDFEWIVLCVARKADGTAALVDGEGRVYEGGIDDFREHNELLSEDDKITFNRHLMDETPPKDVDLITRSGHTESWTPWILGGSLAVAVVVLVGGALLLLRGPRRTDAAAAAAPDDEAAV